MIKLGIFNITHLKMILIFCSIFNMLGQPLAGQIWLKKAENLYDDGQIEKIPHITDKNFEEDIIHESQIKAMRLSTLSYIYDDEWIRADSCMLNLLEFENEYQLLTEDSATEFEYLYKTYRTTPVFSYGFLCGLNASFIHPKESFGTYNINNNNGEYSPRGIGMQAGVQCSFYLDEYIKNLQFDAEIMYQLNRFDYTNTLFDFAKVTVQETQHWINLPFNFSYTIPLMKTNAFFSSKLKNKIKPFLSIGLNPGYLINSKCQALRSYIDKSHPDVKGSDIELNNLRKRFNLWTTAGLGLKYKVPMGLVIFNIRYNYGIVNQANSKKRFSNSELVYNFYYVDNNFTSNNFWFTFGYIRLLYNPRKIKNANTLNYYEP